MILYRGHRSQLALYHVGARVDDAVNGLARRLDLLKGAAQLRLVLGELRLDRGEHALDLVRTLLKRERLVAHLQAVENDGHGGRARNAYLVVALQGLDKAGAIDHLCIQALERQEQDGEIGGSGHA